MVFDCLASIIKHSGTDPITPADQQLKGLNVRSNGSATVTTSRTQCRTQLNYTFDALQNIRYGQSFCNYFDVTDNRIFYDRDWVRCDALIRKEWLSRP
jgi:hypothetical protein